MKEERTWGEVIGIICLWPFLIFCVIYVIVNWDKYDPWEDWDEEY